MGNPKGRPRKADAPIVPWDDVDRLLVFGEKITDEKTGRVDIQFPSYADLAGRYGVSKSRIGQYATKRKCLKRRAEAQAREEIRYEQKMIEKRAEARALSTEEEVQIIDDYLQGFKEALGKNEVRYDNPADFNTMSRLKEFKLGHADSRQEIHGMVSLEQMQARHKQLRDQLGKIEPELAGVVTKAKDGTTDADEPAVDDSGEAIH